DKTSDDILRSLLKAGAPLANSSFNSQQSIAVVPSSVVEQSRSTGRRSQSRRLCTPLYATSSKVVLKKRTFVCLFFSEYVHVDKKKKIIYVFLFVFERETKFVCSTASSH